MHQVMALLLTLVRNLAIQVLCPLLHHILQAVALASSRNTTTLLKCLHSAAPSLIVDLSPSYHIHSSCSDSDLRLG